MVDILDPKRTRPSSTRPAAPAASSARRSGTCSRNGGHEEHTTGFPDTREQLIAHQDRLQEYADDHLFGADFDRFLVRTSSMSVMMLTGKPGNIYYMDSLAFPRGHLGGRGKRKLASRSARSSTC